MKLNYNAYKTIKDAPSDELDILLNNYLKMLSSVESGNNPNARARTSSAAGLYQFTERTWSSMIDKMNLPYSQQDRFDPVKSHQVVKQFTKDNLNYIAKNIKPAESVTYTDLYMAHFLGNGGATTFFKALHSNPNTPAASVLPRAAQANRNIFYNKNGVSKTVDEVYKHFNVKFNKANSGSIVQSQQQYTPPQSQYQRRAVPHEVPIDYNPYNTIMKFEEGGEPSTLN